MVKALHKRPSPSVFNLFITSEGFAMNATARTLSIAAVAALASLGAQANDLYGANFEAGVQSTRSRAEIRAEAAQAVTQFKNFVAAESNAATSTLDRASVHEQAVQAARLRQIATGNRG